MVAGNEHSADMVAVYEPEESIPITVLIDGGEFSISLMDSSSNLESFPSDTLLNDPVSITSVRQEKETEVPPIEELPDIELFEDGNGESEACHLQVSAIPSTSVVNNVAIPSTSVVNDVTACSGKSDVLNNRIFWNGQITHKRQQS